MQVGAAKRAGPSSMKWIVSLQDDPPQLVSDLIDDTSSCYKEELIR
jgi:hypothetical protein